MVNVSTRLKTVGQSELKKSWKTTLKIVNRPHSFNTITVNWPGGKFYFHLLVLVQLECWGNCEEKSKLLDFSFLIILLREIHNPD